MAGECQCGALMATPHNGSGPNGPYWSLWSSNYGEVSQWSVTQKEGTYELETQTPEGGASTGRVRHQTLKVSGRVGSDLDEKLSLALVTCDHMLYSNFAVGGVCAVFALAFKVLLFFQWLEYPTCPMMSELYPPFRVLTCLSHQSSCPYCGTMHTPSSCSMHRNHSQKYGG